MGKCFGRANGNSRGVPRLEYRGGVLNALDCRDGAVLVTSQEAVALVADQVADAQRIHSTAPVSFPRAKEKQSETENAASSAEEVPAFGTAEFDKLCQELDHRSLGYRVFKRVFDFVFALLAIVVGFIPGALLCIAIAADTKGSPIYSQERIGKRGKPFHIYKFRSMVKDSDNVEKYFTPEQLETWKRERKVEDDPRITKLGGFLRHTSIDEMPQFINVLIGQIPLRILKTRQDFESEISGVFALPANEERTRISAFSQVKGRMIVDLRTLETFAGNSTAPTYAIRNIFAKHDFLCLDAAPIANTSVIKAVAA
jgi:lipopolysaccharide/colanic/teichoic acid biosynthesis glycosyltransferase